MSPVFSRKVILRSLHFGNLLEEDHNCYVVVAARMCTSCKKGAIMLLYFVTIWNFGDVILYYGLGAVDVYYQLTLGALSISPWYMLVHVLRLPCSKQYYSYIISWYSNSCYILSWYSNSCYMLSWYSNSCYILLWYSNSSYILSWYSNSCYMLSWYSNSCFRLSSRDGLSSWESTLAN